jgi:hypothetical protein
VLLNLGYSEAEIAELLQRGAAMAGKEKAAVKA